MRAGLRRAGLVLLVTVCACASVGPNRIRADARAEIPEGASFAMIRRQNLDGGRTEWERAMIEALTERGFKYVRSQKDADLAMVYDVRCAEEAPDQRPIIIDPVTGMPREISGTRKQRTELTLLSLRVVDLRPTRNGGQPQPLWLASGRKEEQSPEDNCQSGLGAEWLAPRMIQRMGEDIPYAETLAD